MDNLDSVEKFVFADSKEKIIEIQGPENQERAAEKFSRWTRFEPADNSGLLKRREM